MVGDFGSHLGVSENDDNVSEALGVSVNTQTQTHTQIHIYAQIPAYVQLPTLFQPHVPSQSSTHLHHNQAPCPATILVNPPSSAETLIITPGHVSFP